MKKTDTITGTTKSGFEFSLSNERLENYELVEALGELEDNALALTKVVKLLLGEEQTKKLKDHVRDGNGFVSTTKISDEIMEIFKSSKQTKN